jgi:hypothetical protein
MFSHRIVGRYIVQRGKTSAHGSTPLRGAWVGRGIQGCPAPYGEQFLAGGVKERGFEGAGGNDLDCYFPQRVPKAGPLDIGDKLIGKLL